MPSATSSVPRGSTATIVVLGLLSTFGPISLDLYLPALPALAADLRTTTSSAQLSITACLLGLAVGQLVAGPLSDQFGRRRPLIVGLTLYLQGSRSPYLAKGVNVLEGMAEQFKNTELAAKIDMTLANGVSQPFYRMPDPKSQKMVRTSTAAPQQALAMTESALM